MTTKKLRVGILGAARIAPMALIAPARDVPEIEVALVAARDRGRAQAFAAKHGIPGVAASYEEMLADPTLDAIYNPLPNQMHVPWTIKAAEAGKHVLCEKPMGLTAAEAASLIEVRDRKKVKIAEAFMIRTHPQWLRVQQLLAEGRIGQLRSIVGVFSYFNVDPKNIRNQIDAGGGALMDIGCYLIQASRIGYGQEPTRVVAAIDRDPEYKTDRLTSALLEFPGGHAHFTCSTQLIPYQRVQYLGAKGRIEVEIPFNALPDRPMRISIDFTGDLTGSGVTTESFPVCDQYTLQGEAFAKAVFEDGPVPVSVEDAVKNMAIIEAIFNSASSGQWVSPIAG